ncbi:hypothetical protein R3P38DRAFT_2543487, partial [Favolaschia claudopus]
TVVYADNHKAAQIVAILNAVWDDGLFITFGLLPGLITSQSDHYRTDRSLETIRHAKKAQVLFIWMTADSILGECSIPNAAYAVLFFVPGSDPFQSVDLSYILLKFLDKYIRDGDYNRFNIVSLSYQLASDGSFGVLFCDRRLRTVYQQARIRARASHDAFRRTFHHPISPRIS